MQRPTLDHGNKEHPVTQTFGPDASKFPYFQNGYYFNAKGEWIECQHNRDVMVSRGLDFFAGERQLPSPKAPEKMGVYAAMSVAEVFDEAQRLRARLDDEDDADDYVPVLENKDENIRFLDRHAE